MRPILGHGRHRETHVVGICLPCARQPGWHRDPTLVSRPADVLPFPGASRTASGLFSKPNLRDRVINDVIRGLIALGNGEAREPVTHRELLVHIAAKIFEANEELDGKRPVRA